jgi:hypothetical protein
MAAFQISQLMSIALCSYLAAYATSTVTILIVWLSATS